MTDRRPLGTGPTRADDTTGTGPQPARAGLAAERLPTIPAANVGAPAARPQRRVLGAGAGAATVTGAVTGAVTEPL